MLIDSHIHLSRRQFDGEIPCIAAADAPEPILCLTREGLIEAMRAAGIGCLIEPAVELETNGQLLALAEQYPGFVYPAVGVHPTRCADTPWKARKELEALSHDPRLVAIGELGLDYHHPRKEQHRLKQHLWFLWQLELAHQRGLPVILHIRQADGDALRVLRLWKNRLHGGVCHCFNGGAELARVYTGELGLCLGIGGALLMENVPDLEEAVRVTPLEYLLLETDGPYVKPRRPETVTGKVWHRARNTSLILPDVARKIAELKGISVDEVEKVTTENVKRVFARIRNA